MYEICFDDQADHVLAVVPTPQEALAELDRIADETAAQLAANGEGHEQFLLSLVVWDVERGEVVARSGIRG
jgi:hypothetical protein